MKLLFAYLFLAICLVSYSQESTSNPILPRFAVRGNVGIPKVVSSQSFRNSFSGVVDANLNITCKLFSNFFVGVGYSYTYYKAQKAFRDQYVNTYMQSNNGLVKIGFDKFFSPKGFATFSLNAGYNFNQYKNISYRRDSLIGKYPTQFSSSFVEPIIGLYFIVDPNFAIGGHISYNYNFGQFNPQYPGFDAWFDYKRLKNDWNMSMITLGFGFYYGLQRK